MFDDKFIDSLDDDPFAAGHSFCRAFYEFEEALANSNESSISDNVYEDFLDAFGVAQALADANELIIDVPELGSDRSRNLKMLRDYIQYLRSNIDHQHTNNSVQRARKKLDAKFAKAFHYEFSSGDINKAQKLIIEVRDLIANSDLFEKDHRKRLLARLEILQAEHGCNGSNEP